MLSSDSECTVTHMPEPTITLSTADERRRTVVDAAIAVFARTGYAATPVAAVAEQAGISTAYVFKLYSGKEALFVAALERCFVRVVDALRIGADASRSSDPAAVLDAMGEAYARLITDRSLLMLQVHAMSAADVPAIAQALRAGLERVTAFAGERSGAPSAAVQRFLAYGQLCHLIVATGLTAEDGEWAGLIADGIRHY
ncbi:TetR/AcrR family transcriptional regulator [Amnibacterium soli]|uniref:TetR/AcrR family transcriptional regulator n=2 Tax=Amnibacterium soli TaxID=1282736 RepID=A0ABP8YYB1_9MICO